MDIIKMFFEWYMGGYIDSLRKLGEKIQEFDENNEIYKEIKNNFLKIIDMKIDNSIFGFVSKK